MRRLLVALALTALVAACGDSTSPNNSPVGLWTLTSFNGQAPPTLFDQTSTEALYITGSTLTVNANGTFSEAVSWRQTSTTAPDTTGTDTGTWTIQGNTMTFTSTQATYTGTFQGSTITEVGQDTWVYSRVR